MGSNFLEESLAILTRTPSTLDSLLRDLPDAWTSATEGPGTWSPYVVIGHLIHAERADWIPRLLIILEHGNSRPFEPFDREAQLHQTDRKALPALLDEFRASRNASLDRLRAVRLTSAQLALSRRHPALGPVTVPATSGDVDRARSGAHSADQSCYGEALQAGGWPMGTVSVGNEMMRDRADHAALRAEPGVVPRAETNG